MMQQFDKSKGYLQHFGQFATITARRKNVNFEYEKIKEHIKIWVNLLIKLKENNYIISNCNINRNSKYIIYLCPRYYYD